MNEPVQRFVHLMKIYPVACMASEKKLSVFAYRMKYNDGSFALNPLWELENSNTISEISELFFKDKDVFEFACSIRGIEHGITGKMIIEQQDDNNVRNQKPKKRAHEVNVEKDIPKISNTMKLPIKM